MSEDPLLIVVPIILLDVFRHSWPYVRGIQQQAPTGVIDATTRRIVIHSHEDSLWIES